MALVSSEKTVVLKCLRKETMLSNRVSYDQLQKSQTLHTKSVKCL